MSEQEQYDSFPDENDQAEFETAGLGDTGEVSNEDSDPSEGIPDVSTLEGLAKIDAFEARLNSFPLPPPLPTVFIVQSGTGTTWDEVVPVNGTLTTGGPRTFTGDTVSGAALITLAANQSVVVESKDPGTTGNYTRFVAISGGGTGGFFPVLVSHNGDDGGGLPLYDLYALADTGHVTKLNLSGAIAPEWSVPRTFPTAAVTAAVTNSVGMAYMSVAGPIALYFVIEAGC